MTPAELFGYQNAACYQVELIVKPDTVFNAFNASDQLAGVLQVELMDEQRITAEYNIKTC